jgi:hypothetical protein
MDSIMNLNKVIFYIQSLAIIGFLTWKQEARCILLPACWFSWSEWNEYEISRDILSDTMSCYHG